MLSYIQKRGPEGLLYVTKFGSLEGTGAAEVDVDVDVARVLEAIRLTVESNDALRTRYISEGGEWRQEIMGSGHVLVTEYSSPSPDLNLAAAAAFIGPLSPEPGEVPLRVAIVTFEGRPTHVYFAIHHASADNTGADIACREICRRVLNSKVPASTAWQPLQIVEYERSTAGRTFAERSDKYHRVRIRESADRGVIPTDRRETPLREFQLKSPAVVVAAQQIAQRIKVSALNVLLSSYCAALSARLSRDSFPLALTSGNRVNPNLQLSVAQLAQPSSMSIDVAVPTFDELCRRTSDAALLAYRYGMHDPELLEKSFSEVSAERGEEVFFPYLVNLTTLGILDNLDPEARTSQQNQIEGNLRVQPLELRRMLDRTVCDAKDPEDGVRFSDLTLDLYRFSSEADLRLRTNLSFFTDADVRNLLINTERLLVEVSCDGSKNDMRRLVELCSTSS
ncbi:hypothetical protein B1H18_08835 [Streptomyces tsukubensis]|uniref:Condensation domain-containing protein n=2 Tax=Streptomyces tsukubensis TaxID=83656 RepID=A0A1V4AD15_9ACTN|nr:hypothetical protein B1H18_08835 [Streptomyces tsukubensis]